MSDVSIISIMPLVASMSESGREFLARIGRRFGSVEVLAQAQRTLGAHEQFGAQVRLHGFSEADAKLLAAARDAAAARSGTRTKQTDATYVSALEQAKHGRTRVRSVLSSAYRRLRMTGGAQAQAVMQAINQVLTETSGPGGDDLVYAAELERLLETLSEPSVRDLVADSGGAEALAKATTALNTLRRLNSGQFEAECAPRSDTLESDAIDGMIVELARTAQFAARAAAQEFGNRTIANEFRLRLLP
jgi:hypothetical protein